MILENGSVIWAVLFWLQSPPLPNSLPYPTPQLIPLPQENLAQIKFGKL